MNAEERANSPYVDDDPDRGGMSAGAQDGGIVDTGSANDATDYQDAITGRKGGISGAGADQDSVHSGDFRDEEESAGIGEPGAHDGL